MSPCLTQWPTCFKKSVNYRLIIGTFHTLLCALKDGIQYDANQERSSTSLHDDENG